MPARKKRPSAEVVETPRPSDLAKRISDTRALATAAKARVANALKAGDVPPSRVASIAKLDVAVTNLEQYELLQRMTREHGEPA